MVSINYDDLLRDIQLWIFDLDGATGEAAPCAASILTCAVLSCVPQARRQRLLHVVPAAGVQCSAQAPAGTGRRHGVCAAPSLCSSCVCGRLTCCLHDALQAT